MDGSYYSRIFDGIAGMVRAMAIALIIFVPLGIWKLVEILIWLFKHVSVSFG